MKSFLQGTGKAEISFFPIAALWSWTVTGDNICVGGMGKDNKDNEDEILKLVTEIVAAWPEAQAATRGKPV